MAGTLWAPWRMDYILGKDPRPEGCVFCLPKDHLGPLPERLVLYSDRQALIIMNRYPYNNAHLMVAPRRHLGTLLEATPEERLAMVNLAAWATEVLDGAQKPDGYNMGINQGQVAGAGITDHLHLHVTPRYNGDTNYMTVIGETRVIPEHIVATYEKLLGFFS
ncbi:MAG: HIT domain-containing protein [Deltaproteobacteria bacterium]|jgi:ATP adenylyltransferase|nr:HIT domain-containing protein [Deltaproteobacteria bacterium]